MTQTGFVRFNTFPKIIQACACAIPSQCPPYPAAVISASPSSPSGTASVQRAAGPHQFILCPLINLSTFTLNDSPAGLSPLTHSGSSPELPVNTPPSSPSPACAP